MNREPPTTSTIGSLLSDLRDETSTLLRQEVALAKAEINEKAGRIGKNVAEMATGGAIAYAGLIILLIGVAHLVGIGLTAIGLSPEIAVWLGPLLVGAVVAIIGGAMMAKAKKAMSAEKLVPHETIGSLKDDKQWAQNKIHQSNEPSA